MKKQHTTATGSIYNIRFQKGDFVIGTIKEGARITAFKGEILASDLQDFIADKTVIELRGSIEHHKIYGDQLKISSYHRPSVVNSDGEINPSALTKFLVGKIKGLGMVGATSAILDAGGASEFVECLEGKKLLLLQKAHKLFTEPTLIKLRAEWKQEKDKIETISFFADLGIEGVFPQKFWDKWGSFAKEKVQSNPYILMKEIEGIGFKRADAIANRLGVDKYSEQRIEAGILHTLDTECFNNGHCFLHEEDLSEKARRLLELHHMYIDEVVEEMINSDKLKRFDKNIYLGVFWYSEVYICRRIKEMMG